MRNGYWEVTARSRRFIGGYGVTLTSSPRRCAAAGGCTGAGIPAYGSRLPVPARTGYPGACFLGGQRDVSLRYACNVGEIEIARVAAGPPPATDDPVAAVYVPRS